jgi:hypothetical protein
MLRVGGAYPVKRRGNNIARPLATGNARSYTVRSHDEGSITTLTCSRAWRTKRPPDGLGSRTGGPRIRVGLVGLCADIIASRSAILHQPWDASRGMCRGVTHTSPRRRAVAHIRFLWRHWAAMDA